MGKTFRTGTAIFVVPVPLSVQPGTFGSLPWLRCPLCNRSPPGANTACVPNLGPLCPQKTVGVRYCPPEGRAAKYVI